MQKNYDLLTKTTRKPQLSGARCAGHRVLKPLQNAKPFRWLTAILTFTLSLLMGQSWAQTPGTASSGQAQGRASLGAAPMLLSAGPAGSSESPQSFSTAGTYDCQIPQGTYKIVIECWGGGGAGAKSEGGGSGKQGYGGGGGGFIHAEYNLSCSDSYPFQGGNTLTVGVAASSSNNGNPSFVQFNGQDLARATGGTVGTCSAAGQGGSGSYSYTPSSWQFKTGGKGGSGNYYNKFGTTHRAGGGGGGVAGYYERSGWFSSEIEYSDGSKGLNGLVFILGGYGGGGGDGYAEYGTGSSGNGGSGAGDNGTGNPGTNYGGGGGGGTNSNIGGNGAQGYVKITFYTWNCAVSLDANGGSLVNGPSGNTFDAYYMTTYNSNTGSWNWGANGVTRVGYAFDGWHKGSVSGNVLAGTEMNCDNTTPNLTLVSKWNPYPITVTLNSNKPAISTNNPSSCSNIQVNYDAQMSNLTCEPSMSGWTFDGWYTASGTKVTSSTTCNMSDIVLNNATQTGTLELFAHWSFNPGTITNASSIIHPCGSYTIEGAAPASTSVQYKWFCNTTEVPNSNVITLSNSNYNLNTVGQYTFTRQESVDGGTNWKPSAGSYTVTVQHLQNAGAISPNTSFQTACVGVDYEVHEQSSAASVDGQTVHYKWSCTRYQVGQEPQAYNTAVFAAIDLAEINTTDNPSCKFTEPGLYVITRSAYAGCNTETDATVSNNEFRINIISPNQNVANAFVSNYPEICMGGTVTLTPTMTAANITMPDITNPSNTTTLTPNGVTYQCQGATVSGNTVTINSTGEKSIYAYFTYPNIDNNCKAKSAPLTVEVVDDPYFDGDITVSPEETCPAGQVTITTPELVSEISGTDQPYTYTWYVLDENETGDYVPVGPEAQDHTYPTNSSAQFGNFIWTENEYLLYSVEVSNALGCNVPVGDNEVEVLISNISAPEVSKTERCPSDETFTFTATADDNELRWYADNTTTTYSTTAPTQSLANEGTFMKYVSQYADGGCESARVPDTLVVRYTAHLSHSFGNLTQTKCQESAIDTIKFAFDGNVFPEVEGTLPAGVETLVDSANHTYNICGTLTEAGIFNYTVKLPQGEDAGSCSEPTTFSGTLTVNPTYHQTQFFSSCENESITIGGQTFNAPGTYTIPLQTVGCGCDSIITLIYTQAGWNQFGYEENEELLAGWSDFSSATSAITSDVNTEVYGGTISYSGWNGTNTTRGGLESTSSYITATGNSLGLVNKGHYYNNLFDQGWESNNNKSIILKTSTKGYDDVNLHFDYGAERQLYLGIWSNNDKAFTKVTFAYSLDGVNYTPISQSLQIVLQETSVTTGSINLNLANLLEQNAAANQDNLYIKMTFDGSAYSNVPGTDVQYFRIDNVAFTGIKAIDELKITNNSGSDVICTNAEATLEATAPYINNDVIPADTADITYKWERIVGGTSTVIQEGSEYEDHILVDAEIPEGPYKYVVSVGQGNCLMSDTLNVTGRKPTYDESVTYHGSVCSNRINNITDITFSDVTYQEGMVIVETSMEELSVPGVHTCKLSIPSDENPCGYVVNLELTVNRAFDTTIVENICLGETYNKYGINFTPTVEGVTNHQSPVEWHCANDCDSVYRVTLITNSVRSTVTDQENISLAEWNMSQGTHRFRVTNGVRTKGATFTVGGPAATFENVEGHTPSSDYGYTESTGALRWPNLTSDCSGLGNDATYTSYEGVTFEIALNVKDYTNLKAKFDYKRENATTRNAQAFNNVKYSYKLDNGSYSTPQNQSLTNTDWTTQVLDFSAVNTQDVDTIYLKLEFTGGNVGGTERCGTFSGSQYLPSYITIDNLKIWGNKPARAHLDEDKPTLTYTPTGASAPVTVPASTSNIAICGGAEVTFNTQAADEYFVFVLSKPDGTEDTLAQTTTTFAPSTTGNYNILARNEFGCDKTFEFYITVNNLSNISDCTVPNTCSEVPFEFVPVNGVNGYVPDGTVYSWSAPQKQGITGTASGTNASSITGTLTNTTPSIIDVEYTVSATAGGCPGNTFRVTVPVFPEVTASFTAPTDTDFCPGANAVCTLQVNQFAGSSTNRKLVWSFNGNETTTTVSQANNIYTAAMPDECKQAYDLVASYSDDSHCTATATITLRSVDTIAPVLATGESWPQDITGQNACYAGRDIEELKSDDYIKSIYIDQCNGEISVTHTDYDSLTQDCGWKVTRTYTIKDACGNTVTPKPTMSVMGGNTSDPVLAAGKSWPDNITGQNNSFDDADTSVFYTNAQVKALYIPNCGTSEITVTHTQTNDKTDDCDWMITRTYTITDGCSNFLTKTQSLSGSDQTAPTYTRPADAVAYLQLDGTVASDTSKTGVPTNVSDNSNNKCDTTYRDETYTYACGVSFNRIWRVTDACGNVSTSDSVQKITVEDTLTPRINGNWADSIVYLTAYNACGYTLPDTLKTVAEVNALVTDFIKGQNLNSAITMHQDTTNKGACDMYILRTYTVTDTCSTKSATFTHKIFVSDTTKPVLAGSWPANITGQNHIYAEADTSGLKSDDDIKALFNDCHDITVTHTQAPTLVSNCGWTIVRTYHIEDACHNGFDSTMSVSGANQNAPMRLADTWPTGASNVNTCLTNPDTSSLKADTAIAKLFSDTCGVYVTHKDSVVVGSTDCNWTIIRTYSIKDSCENEVTPAPFMTVTGGDTSKPVFTCPADLTLYRTADCTYDADTATTHSVPTAISDNCTEPDNLTVVFSDDTVAGACSAAITIKRTWSVTDACNNVRKELQVITISDSITPKMLDTATWIAELDTQKNCARSADTTVFYTDAQVKAKFYDNCSNAVIVTHTQNFEEDGQCFWNAIRTYTISDSCGNTTTRTQKLPGSAIDDPLAPTLISENTWPENVTGNDNCFANADTSLLYNDDEVAALFEDQCSVVILVSHEDDTVASADNGWEILRTYTIKDGCGNTVYFDESLPTMSLSGADSTAPVLSCAWPHDITGITACPSAVEDTSALLTDDIVKAMFSDCCAITVTHENETFDVEEVNCGWEVRRTYTITDACNNSTDTTISIFGTMEGEGSAPTRNDSAWPEDITGQNNCFANADTTGLSSNAQIAALFTNDCSGVVVTHTDDITSNTSNCGWTITRTYTVKDVCGNTAAGTFTMKVTGSDQTAPALITEGTWPSDSNQINKSIADIPAGPTKAEIKALFTDCAEITVDSVRNVTGTDCDWTAKFCYEIKDECNNTVKDTVTYTGGDNEKPKFVCPKDTTLNLTVDGTVDASPEKTGKPAEVSDNYTLAADMKISHIDRDTTVICGNTFFFTREWHVADTCGNDSVKTQTITVADTMKPTLASLTWTDSTVYLKIDTTYTLPNAFTTIAEVNGKVAGFIKGNNLNPNLTMVADTQNRNTCGLYVLRTYTVKDTCNHKTSSFTHTILVEDTLIPEINGNWADSTVYLTAACGFTLPTPFTTVSQLNALKPGFISGPNLVENVALRIVADTNNVGTCDWNVVRTYDVKDSCSNKTKSFTHTIYVKDTIAPVLAEDKVWLKDSLNQNRLFVDAYTAPLADNDSVKKLFHDCTILKVTHKDDTLADSNCGWKIKRTYTITDDCNNKKVDSVFIGGSDQTKPVINGTHPQVYTENTNANVNTFTKESTSWNVTATDNDEVSTISYELTGATTGSGITSLQNVAFNTGKTIVKWTVTDVCGNDTTCTDTIKIINVNPITVYISENTDTVTYDGQEHTLTGYVVDSISNNLYTTADFKLKASAINDTIVKGTLAGSYSMPLDNDDFENVSPYFNNIHFNVTSRDLVIKQNPAVITIASGSHTFDASEYDGLPHYFPSYVVKYNDVEMPRTAQDSTKFVLTTGDTLAVTAVGYVTSAVDNRDKNNTFTWILQNANCYVNEVDTNGLVGTIRFNAYPQAIQIASLGKTWTYDGDAHSYPKYTVKFGDDYATCFADDTTKFILPISGDTVRIQSTASITNVGKVANTFTYTIDHEEMYVGSRDTIIDTLRMIPLTGVEVTIVERTDTATYNGAMHYVTGYDVANISSTLYSASYFSYNGGISHKTADGRYAGTYPMGVLSTDFVNMNTNFDGVIFTIVDRDLVVKPIQSNIQITANSAEKNYDGTQLTNNGFTFTTDVALVAGDTIVALVTGSQTEAGSSANVVEEYHIWRKKSFNVDMLAASMSTPDAYDDVTNCYTFATPATVAGTLRVNNAFVVVSKDSTDVDCYGKHNGTITIVVEGGKLVYGKYNYEMLGPNSFRVAGQTDDTLYLRGLYPGAYTVTFKDGMDSTVTATFSINQPDTMVAEIAAPEELCPNQGSYPVSVTVTGGNGTNAYVWGSNATNVDAASTVVAQIGASDCDHEYTAAVQVTDAKGCVAKDTVKFTVVDNEAPVFTVPGDITICRNADGEIDAPTSVTGVPTGYSDNCSNEATLIRHTQWLDLDTTGNVNTLMVIHRQWTVTDSCDNPTVKVQNITIKPGIGVAGSDYVLTAPENIEITLKYGQVDTLLTNIGTAVASNLPAGIAAPDITDNRPGNNRYPEGTTVVVWTATDECGFTVTATQTIVVNYPLCEPVIYEGHEYPVVRLAGNCWMAENLRNTQYADGTDVPNYSSYNDANTNAENYGLLYSWYSAVRVPENNDNAVPTTNEYGYIQGLCPDGWAIPAQNDYNSLFAAAGSTDVLKDLNTQYWLPGAAGTTPNKGFNARGAGYYDQSIGRYMNLLGEAYFWSYETGATVTRGKCSVITHYCPELINQNQDKGMGFSVRCIRKR